MRLGSPYALVLLLLVPVLLLLSRRRQHTASMAYSSIHDLAVVPPSVMTRLRRMLPVLRALVLIGCILALARPQQGLKATRVYSEGIAIAMVIDISGSMGALDMHLEGQPSNRLEVVKHTFRTFVQGYQGLPGRGGDLIGMVTFARYADSICPLTLDHDTLIALLDRVELTPPEEDGTAIGEAIALGAERLQGTTAKSRVMILLTDGANNAGDTEPLPAARIAKALGIKIYTIGAGTRGVAPAPVRTPDGRTVLQQVRVFTDEASLKEIAEVTGGRYFRATDGAALQVIYAEIGRLEKSPHVTEHYQEYGERFPLILLPSLGLLVLEMVLVNTRFRKIP